jgi:hypothetical protein
VRQLNGSMCLHEARWQRLLLLLALLPALLALNSCGSGASSTPVATPSLTVSPLTASVTAGGAPVQFTPNPVNLSSTLVKWEVNTVAGGTATFGTIDATGLYTPPATAPSANIVTITAVSQAQTTITGTATVTISIPTAISSVVCEDSGVQTLTISSGRLLACTAFASGGSVVNSFWKVNSVLGGSAATGFISTQGNYVAPQIPPTGGTITITAVSQADSKQTQMVSVAVTFGNAALQGSYAFSMAGKFTSTAVTNPFFLRAGSFTADGSGILSAGNEDLNQSSGVTTVPFTGTYSIGPDGRGTLQFCEHTSVVCSVAATTVSFRIVVLSPQKVQIIQFEVGATASGEMVSQAPSVFNDAGLSGTYTFNFSGVSSGSAAESMVGEFFADGLGGINLKTSPQAGEMDVNDGVTLTHLFIQNTSTYSIGADGRGTATLVTSGPTLNFNFYMVSANAAKFIERDSISVLTGNASKQQSSNPWGASTLNGNIVLETSGTDSSGGIADLIGFTASNVANSGTLTAVFIDENSSAVTPPPAGSLLGTYTFDSTGSGRGTLNIPNHSYVFYMIAPAPSAAAVVQETTAGIVAGGSMIQQQPVGVSFNAASFQGSYAFGLSGFVGANEEDMGGQLTADGNPTNAGPGKITSATLDINNFGTLLAPQANTGTYNASVASNGRTTMSLTPTVGPSRSFVLYFLNPTTVFCLGIDNTEPATAVLTRQF